MQVGGFHRHAPPSVVGHLPGHAGHVVRRRQRRAQVDVAQTPRLLGGELDPQPHYRAGYRMPLDGPDHEIRRVLLVLRNGGVDGHERTGRNPLEPEIGQPFALGRFRVNVHHAETLVVRLLGKVHPLQAAGVCHRRPPFARRTQYLVLVNMSQRHVLQLRLLHRADVQHVVVAQHHGAFRPHGGAVHRHMTDQDGRRVRVNRLGLPHDGVGHPPFRLLPDFLDAQAARFFSGQHRAPGRPGHGQRLHRPGRRRYEVGIEARADVHVGNLQRGEYLDGMSPAGGGRQVVVAGQQERGYAGVGQPQQATGQLPLVGLGRVAPLVSVAGQQHQVNAVGQGELHQFVQRAQKVAQPGG